MSFYERLQSLQFQWTDAVDIILVSVIIYSILRLIRGTRAMQMAVGLLVIAGSYFLARTLNLLALETLTRVTLLYLPFAIIVLFQHEFRRALANFGRNPLVALFSHPADDSHLDAVIEATSELSKRKVGALIVLERTQSLRVYVESGKRIDAAVSSDLLVNIFTPNAPLHDGAVIIQHDRIAAAGTFLPLTSNEISGGHGTRHRAALGLSEETDAFVIVVSEENGSVSAALDGKLEENLAPANLAELIHKHLAHPRRGIFR